jgi:FAD/FMN-containing dehydrogenase
MVRRRLHSAATFRAIAAAIGRTRARSIAVIFPSTPSAELAEGDEALPALRAYADRLGKQVVVIGGDEALRARAVAAGFPVATSLEEWQTDEHEALAGWPSAGSAGSWEAESVLVLPEPEQNMGAAVPREEMPEYVRRIRDLSGHYTGPLDAEPGQRGRLPRVTPRITMPLPAVELDADGDTGDAVRRAQERREERITRAIRRTGGPSLGLEPLWAAGEMPPGEGEGETPESGSV